MRVRAAINVGCADCTVVHPRLLRPVLLVSSRAAQSSPATIMIRTTMLISKRGSSTSFTSRRRGETKLASGFLFPFSDACVQFSFYSINQWELSILHLGINAAWKVMRIFKQRISNVDVSYKSYALCVLITRFICHMIGSLGFCKVKLW